MQIHTTVFSLKSLVCVGVCSPNTARLCRNIYVLPYLKATRQVFPVGEEAEECLLLGILVRACLASG